MKPTLAYGTFEVRRLARNVRFLIFTVGLPAGTFLLVAGNSRPGQRSDGLPARTAFLIGMATLAVLVAGLNLGGGRLAAELRSGWIRYLRLTSLSGRGWVVAKFAVGLVLAIPAVLLVYAVGVLDGHVHLPVSTWSTLLIVLTIGVLPFVAIGLVVGLGLDGESAEAGTFAVALVLAFLGGLFFPITNLPDVLQVVAKATPTYELAAVGRAVAAHRSLPAFYLTDLVVWTVGLAVLTIALWFRNETRSIG